MVMVTANQPMMGIPQPTIGLRPAIPVPVQAAAMLPSAVAIESKTNFFPSISNQPW